MLLFMELIFWLDLLPILMLFWWQTLAVLAVVATLGLLVLLKRSADRKTQFSVRALLLVMFFFAWPLGRLATQISMESRRIRKQQDCMQALSKHLVPISFSSRYNDGVRDNFVQKALMIAGSSWLDNNRAHLQIWSFATVDLSGSSVTEELLAAIANTGTVTHLDLSSTNVTDDGIRQLCQLASLRHLVLNDTGISDATIKNLTDQQPDLDVEH